MRTHEIDPSAIEGFYWNPAVSTAQKLGRFATGTHDQYHLLFDVDGCMTTPKPDSFGAMSNILSRGERPDGSVRDDIYLRQDLLLNDIYYPVHASGNMKDYDAVMWWALTLQNYIDAHIAESEIVEEAQKIEARPGLLATLGLAKHLSLPSIAMSAGVGNAIEVFLKEHNIKLEALMANWLTDEDNDGYVDHIDWNSMIHVNNKFEMTHGNGAIEELRQERGLIFLFGDGSKDPRMAKGNRAGRIATRIGMPQGLSQVKVDGFLRKSFRQGYDAVSKDGTFRSTPDMIGTLVEHELTAAKAA
jgi:hypothetical protein